MCLASRGERYYSVALGMPIFAVLDGGGALLVIDRHIELCSASGTFDGLAVTLRCKYYERLLLASQVADRTWKGFVRPQSVPPINEPLNVDWRGAVYFEVVEQDMEQSGVLHRVLRD